MLTVFLVDLKCLSGDEKSALREHLSGFAFMVSDYYFDNVLDGFVVFWETEPVEFIRLIATQPKCDYVNATGWNIDKEHITQAFNSAFGR